MHDRILKIYTNNANISFSTIVPAETELASYPKVSFWKKFKEHHSLIRTKPRAFDMNKAVDERTDSPRPLNWLLKPSGTSILLAWRSKVEEFEMVDEDKRQGHVRQLSLVPNPASWVIRSVGLVLFLGFHVLSMLRYQRGYSDGQDLLGIFLMLLICRILLRLQLPLSLFFNHYRLISF